MEKNSSDSQGKLKALAIFSDLSAHLSGFSETELSGTGMLEVYYDKINLIIGEREMGQFLAAYHDLPNTEDDIEYSILHNERYGPVARNIIRLWYLGEWKQLPQEWRNVYGATSFDVDHIVSPQSYQESLIWIAAGAHPMGAKQQGFGAWSVNPESLLSNRS